MKIRSYLTSSPTGGEYFIHIVASFCLSFFHLFSLALSPFSFRCKIFYFPDKRRKRQEGSRKPLPFGNIKNNVTTKLIVLEATKTTYDNTCPSCLSPFNVIFNRFPFRVPRKRKGWGGNHPLGCVCEQETLSLFSWFSFRPEWLPFDVPGYVPGFAML